MDPQQRRLALASRKASLRRIARTGLLPLLLASSLAHAQQTDEAAIDIAAGRQRAAVCFACHNADGISQIPGTPNLAGQDRGYLEHALRAYRDGKDRRDATMNAMAQPLSDRDIANIAAYFNALPRTGAAAGSK